MVALSNILTLCRLLEGHCANKLPEDWVISKPATTQVDMKNQTIQKFKSRAIENIEMRPIPEIQRSDALRSHAPTGSGLSSPVKPGKAW